MGHRKYINPLYNPFPEAYTPPLAPHDCNICGYSLIGLTNTQRKIHLKNCKVDSSSDESVTSPHEEKGKAAGDKSIITGNDEVGASKSKATGTGKRKGGGSSQDKDESDATGRKRQKGNNKKGGKNKGGGVPGCGQGDSSSDSGGPEDRPSR